MVGYKPGEVVPIWNERKNQTARGDSVPVSYTHLILWAAALTDDADKARALYSPVVRYLRETPSRVPFGDWYYADRGDIVHFINRSVVGGVFAPLLKASGRMRA